MSERTSSQIALEIDVIRAEVGPLLAGRDHLPTAMALCMLAAEHVLHDGENEESFLRLARGAWNKVKRDHS